MHFDSRDQVADHPHGLRCRVEAPGQRLDRMRFRPSQDVAGADASRERDFTRRIHLRQRGCWF
jgi:hypothetical protein